MGDCECDRYLSYRVNKQQSWIILDTTRVYVGLSVYRRKIWSYQRIRTAVEARTTILSLCVSHSPI